MRLPAFFLIASACALAPVGCSDGGKTVDLPDPKTAGPADPNAGAGGESDSAAKTAAPPADKLRIKPEQIGDWPTFLGPEHTGVSRERGLLKTWPDGGPPIVWRMELGETYSVPSVVKGAAIIFHRVGDEDVIERVDPETGRKAWRFAYATDYRDQFGYNDGPRSAPTIDDGRVYTLGAQGSLHCVDLETGKPIWSRALHAEYFKDARQNFFGVGTAPRIEGDAILLNLGDDRVGCVTAIDKRSGKTLWRTGEDAASYCTAFCADVGNVRTAFFLTREGALACSAADGIVRGRYAFRSRERFSANAASPVVVGDTVFLSAAYNVGSALLKVTDRGFQEVWRNDALGAHWATPIYVDGHVYGFDGRHEHEATLRCVRLSDGKVMWQKDGYDRNAAGEEISTRNAYERGSMIRVEGKFIILTESGRLALADLSPAGAKEISSVKILARHCWGAPVLSRGLLYVSDYNHNTKKGSMVCLDLREK